jgi:putative polyhydroxyalkanoate system protein
MPSIRFHHHHTLGPGEARQRLQQLMDRFSRKYGFHVRWEQEGRASVKGRGVKGSLELKNGQVRLDLNLSFLLSPFKSKIEEGIVRQIVQALPPAQETKRAKA